jgi:hypothetical protein
VTTPIGEASSSSIGAVLIDLNADGIQDLLVDGLVYIRSDSSEFTAVVGTRVGREVQTFTSVAGGDLDSDGDMDLVVGFESDVSTPLAMTGVKIFLNPGDGDFSNVAPFLLGDPFDRVQVVRITDLNGDGKLDLAVANRNQRNKVYIDRGGGLFDPAGLEELMLGTDADDTLSLEVRAHVRAARRHFEALLITPIPAGRVAAIGLPAIATQ